MNYLVTGGHGKLGSALCPLIEAVVPTRTEMNILEKERVDFYATHFPVDAILHLAAVSDTVLAEKDTHASYAINVRGTANVAEVAKKHGKKIIYISTDYVFPGTTGDYRETDEPSPSNWYGFTKYAGELEIRERTDNFLIIRTAFRPSVWPFKSAYGDVYTSADYVDVIAGEIAKALMLDITGILHIGTAKKTLFELAGRRNPAIVSESSPVGFPKRKDLHIEKWERLKRV